MTENLPTLEEWRKLYQAIIRVKEIAPWEWMSETDVFGVQNPETNELGFVSVMGMLGEHYAIAVYAGSEGLYAFQDFQAAGPFASPERLLEIPQLQASLENRNQLHDKDRKMIKELGFKFRGRHAWPMFRSFRPGYLPWFLEAREARLLTHALEQTLDVTPRFRKAPSLLPSPDDGSYLVRVPRQKGGILIWEERIIHVPPPEATAVSLTMDIQMLEGLKRLPRSKNEIEVDFFILPTPIRERDARPYFPYILMVVDARSGLIFGNEMLKPEPSLEAMWGLVPMNMVQVLARVGVLPKEVRVRSTLLLQLLQPLAGELRFKLKQSRRLPSLDSAKQFMLDRFI